MVDIQSASALVDFKVIEIVDDSNTYPMLLIIDWDFYMYMVINMKKWKMTFERKSFRVVLRIDPAKGVCYTKHVRDFVEEDDDLDQIYKITS